MSERRTAVLVSTPIQIEFEARDTVHFRPHRLCPIDGLSDSELEVFKSSIGRIVYSTRVLDGPPKQPEPVKKSSSKKKNLKR